MNSTNLPHQLKRFRRRMANDAPPMLCCCAKRLGRARMRKKPRLAFINLHRADFFLQSAGDIHEIIRAERRREFLKGPFRGRRNFIRIKRLDGRPGHGPRGGEVARKRTAWSMFKSPPCWVNTVAGLYFATSRSTIFTTSSNGTVSKRLSGRLENSISFTPRIFAACRLRFCSARNSFGSASSRRAWREVIPSPRMAMTTRPPFRVRPAMVPPQPSTSSSG